MRTIEGVSNANDNTNKESTMMQTNNNSTTIALPKPQHANNTDDISLGVQDTIYLCNFRVSVDGEWLCLKELQDLDIQDASGKKTTAEESNGLGHVANYDIANNRFDGDGLSKCERDWVKYYSRDPAAIERSNLVNICKLVVKELLEQSLRFGRMLDSDHLPLQHFFIVLEHVLRHGLRPKKGLLGPKKELWDLLQSVEKYCMEAQDITASVRDLPTVRTHIGRARAWLRIALMQKKLADYMQALIEHKDDALFEYYEPHALMMSDEVVVIMGILLGLNVIDCNLCVKEEDLDSQQGVIDFSLYLRSSSRNSPEDDGNALEGPGGNMTAVLDQKNYIEELNRHLNATVANLQAKVESLTTTNALMKEDLAIARNNLLALQAENQSIKQSSTFHANQMNHANQTSNDSSNSSERIDSELTVALAQERKKNQELEKELKLQISLKAETDMAMKLLEKDIHEKQDTIISLRRQLEDIKQINLEMYKKLQECEASLTHKTELLTKLEKQKDDFTSTISQLEKQFASDKSNTSKTLMLQITACEERAARAEADVRLERDWRASLQEKEIKLKDQINNLQMYVKQLTEETKKNDRLKAELERVRKQWSDSQITLEELGMQLSVSKLKLSEIEEKEQAKEKLYQYDSGAWTPDSIASNCKGCNREFSMTRRKHHCRFCGEIFCNGCSDHVAPLPSQSSKPVRICDKCWDKVAANRV